MDTVRRELTLILVVQAPAAEPLGQTLIDASQTTTVALARCGIVVEKSDVRGRELS